MIIGKINGNEKRIKFDLDISCSNCGKRVPGGLQASEKFYNTNEFKIELENFQKTYLCGKCRDKKRMSDLKKS
ncbi:MAG: hypothetical protein QF559_04465 [Candidatus Nitrosopelagicus sp.]|jgi:DNA-directed RNA polymerase subunit RPC12/RpoP|nr:hypothetical protein [Candidatus Nitrosopelagicus sp.]